MHIVHAGQTYAIAARSVHHQADGKVLVAA